MRVVVVAAALAVLAGCGSSSTTGRSSSSTTTTSTTTTSSTAPPEPVERAVARVDHPVLVSPVAHVGDADVVVIAAGRDVPADGPDDRHIEVVVRQGSTWEGAASLRLPSIPRFFFGATPIVATDVTGDGRADFLVPLEAVQHVGAVVSDDGGTWRLLRFARPEAAGRPGSGLGRPEDVIIGVQPRFEGEHLVTDDRLCQPSCAEGGVRAVTWRYDRARQVLTTDAPLPP